MAKKALYFTKISITLFLIGTFNNALSQSAKKDSEVYLVFDQIVGKTNTGVFNGTEYFNKFRTINEKHQFFKGDQFYKGSLLLTEASYPDLDLKYDVYLDELIIGNLEILGSPMTVIDKGKVVAFTIGNSSFVNIKKEEESSDRALSGYAEILSEKNSLVLLKKHKKAISRKTNSKRAYYEFKDGHYYFLKYKNQLYPLKNLKSLISIFPDQKTILKTSYDSHQRLKKTQPDVFFKSIISDLQEALILKQTKG